MKREVIVSTRRVGYDGHYFLIVPDHASGRRKRFTVYRVPASPSRRVNIVGRELTLGYALGIIGIHGRKDKLKSPPCLTPNENPNNGNGPSV